MNIPAYLCLISILLPFPEQSPSLRNGAAHSGLSLPTLITVETTGTHILIRCFSDQRSLLG